MAFLWGVFSFDATAESNKWPLHSRLHGYLSRQCA